VLQEGEVPAITSALHNGTDGSLEHSRGALSFRIGDFFSGEGKEQMRLTEDGNLGIGTDKPQAKLDVAGTVRAREGFLFADGSKLNVNEKGSLLLTNADGAVAPNAAGTGTQNRVAKWTETGGSGTLGDSLISESGGNVVVGNAAQTGNIQIFGTAAQDVFAGMGPDLNNGPAFNYGYAGGTFGRSAGFFNVRPDASAVAPNPSLRFLTANVQRMIVTNTGNVGIGTSNPLRTLQIGPNSDAAFTFEPSNGTPNAGYIRFGDKTGWKLHFARNRESSGGALNSGTTGVLMTIQDDGNVGVGTQDPRLKLDVAGDATIDGRVGLGTASPQAKLDVRGSIRLGNNGEFSAASGEENLRIVRGIVASNGNIIVGSGFTASLTDTGKYTITFNTPFADPPAVTITTNFTPGFFTTFAETEGVTGSQANIRIFVRSNGDNANNPFQFIAIGPR
jgi:hypothetical protein